LSGGVLGYVDGILLACESIVASTEGCSSESAVDESVAAAGLGRLGRIATDVLVDKSSVEVCRIEDVLCTHA
jgi:hypothetical protein